MALQRLYQTFLSSPSADLLAEDAAFHYVTTLTTINKATAIAKHLTTQNTQVLEKKQEKILNCIESQNALCLETETTIEFLAGGGAYLPNLDDNFLTDRVVSFPIIHIVHFDSARKIKQIRLHWDQGSLLKLVDVIGSRAKNWPIRLGHDQARLVASSVSLVDNAVPAGNGVHTQSRSSSPSKRNNAMNDPHASLSLFETKDHILDRSQPAVIAPRASAKPPPRDYHDLFVGGDSNPKGPSRPEGPFSPKKGAGKNFQPSRLFDVDDADSERQGPLPGRGGPKRNDHFDIGNNSVEEPRSPPKKSSKTQTKHDSQWNFEGFSTPDKVPTKIRSQDVRHFGWSEEDAENAKPPAAIAQPGQPRRDAETHFEFQDDGTPAPGRRLIARPKTGATHNVNLGLYRNNLYDEDEASNEGVPPADAKPLGNVTNNVSRRKDFDAHYSLGDNSPDNNKTSLNENNKPVADDRKKAVKMMNSTWDSYDNSPDGNRKENMNTRAIYKTHGDGMGGKKSSTRHWGFGDDSDVEVDKPVPGRKQQQKALQNQDFWDF
ncbi:MAG: hypothetical protein M1834_005175 [Cirrosporium novae-zelandiae]|nr:MAG: hypothetical protein M1834_005175 [Cirrosporium novae-zelandiae]